jgi:hypothetical protein
MVHTTIGHRSIISFRCRSFRWSSSINIKTQRGLAKQVSKAVLSYAKQYTLAKQEPYINPFASLLLAKYYILSLTLLLAKYYILSLELKPQSGLLTQSAQPSFRWRSSIIIKQKSFWRRIISFRFAQAAKRPASAVGIAVDYRGDSHYKSFRLSSSINIKPQSGLFSFFA